MRYQIICDSGCDFTATELLGSSFQRVPMALLLDGQAVLDNFLPGSGVPQTVRDARLLASAAPTREDYLAAFSRSPAENIYVLTISAGLSVSYQNAYRARKDFLEQNPSRNLHVFNTRTVSAGMLLLARSVSSLALSGCSFSQIVETVEAQILGVSTLLCLGRPKALLRSSAGRRLHLPLTPGSGVMLELTQAGELRQQPSALPRRQVKLLNARALELSRSRSNPAGGCVVSHCACPERAGQLGELLQKSGRFSEVIVVTASGLGALYGGPGSLAVAF